METQKKIRKPMTPEALEKLSLARAKANEMRTQNKLTKIDDKKINKLELKMSELKKKKVEKEPVQEEVQEETPTEVVTPCVIKPKKTVKKKPVVIVEQSSDDEDDFEANDRVIFVKRTTRKKKEEKEEKVEKEVITMPTPPEIIQPVEYKQPELTQREIFLNATYNNMINGNFLESFPRRR